MKNVRNKSRFFIIGLLFFSMNTVVAQTSFNKIKKQNNQSVVMTWNKNTPEQEMQDDIKALRENNQVDIDYTNVKRNSKGEIIALKITYKDDEGNSGSQEYAGKNPIPTIKFYKDGNKIGFGEPNDISIMPFNNFSLNDINKQFFNGFSIDSLRGNEQSFYKKNIGPSKIIVQEDGKKMLIIEDGKVIEGGEDYTPEEIEKFKKQNQFNFRGADQFGNFEQLNDKMLRLKNEFLEDNEKDSDKFKKDADADKPLTRAELQQMKKEMQQVKKEIEAAKKELNKAKKR
jgi:hypothetical protein